jgi:uncharacterized protein
MLRWQTIQKFRRYRWVRWLQFIVITYLVFLVLLGLLENSLVYPRWAIPPGNWEPIGLHPEDAVFTTEDGIQLHGWYFEHPQPRAHVLYFHGNGTDVSHLGPEMQAISRQHALSMLVFDYRGYGRSEGRPTEQGLYRDAEAAQQWLAERTGQSPRDIVLMGRSLGGAVAVEAAVTHGARGLILERTFSSLPAVAASIYWWLPVRWLMRNRFDSLRKIPQYRGPLLQSHGTADSIVPFTHGKQLFEAAGSDAKRFVVLHRLEHNDPDPEEYWRAFDEFFDQLPPPSGLATADGSAAAEAP